MLKIAWPIVKDSNETAFGKFGKCQRLHVQLLKIRYRNYLIVKDLVKMFKITQNWFMNLTLQMSLCVVTPLDIKRTGKSRDMDEATVFFPYDKDFGLDLSDIPLFLVFNGIDHYCSVQPLKKNFKDGTRTLYELLSKARALSDTLAQSTDSAIVKGIFQKASENSIPHLVCS